jgi:hypothetical protein
MRFTSGERIMSESKLTPDELGNNISYKTPSKNWMDPKVEFNMGTFNYSGIPKNVEYLQLPNPRKWQPTEDDWQLPENWKEIILNGLKERLDRFRSLKIFMDICVRCGACADKCHFYIGSGDPRCY